MTLRKRSPGHECGTMGTCYDVIDPLARVIGHVRMYAATNTSWGSSRHVDRGWTAVLADGSEPELYTLYDTRSEAVTAILRAVHP